MLRKDFLLLCKSGNKKSFLQQNVFIRFSLFKNSCYDGFILGLWSEQICWCLQRPWPFNFFYSYLSFYFWATVRSLFALQPAAASLATWMFSCVFICCFTILLLLPCMLFTWALLCWLFHPIYSFIHFKFKCKMTHTANDSQPIVVRIFYCLLFSSTTTIDEKVEHHKNNNKLNSK